MDKSLAKKYSKIAVTLGVIAGGSALLIGLANVITEGPIKQNEINKKLESIKVVYGENAKYGDEVIIASEHKEAYPHLLSYYNAKDANDKALGNVFITSGDSGYGKIKMAVGVGTDYSFDKISLIVNEQSFADKTNTFVEEFNSGKRTIDDVECGATFAATLINEMAKESLSYYKNVMLEESGVETRDFLANIFGENSKYGEEVKINNESYKKVKSYYTATSKNDVLLGYVFVAEDSNQYGKIKMSVGITADGKIGKIFLIENTQSFADKVQGYVDGVNGGKDIDDVSCGATVGATTVNGMAKEALTFYKGEIKKEITDYSPYCAQVFKDKDTKFIRRNLVIDKDNKNLVEHWTATDKDGNVIGRVYHVDMDDVHFMIGVNVAPANPMQAHTLKGMAWVNAGDDADALALIEKVNAGEDIGEPADTDKALVKAIKTAIKQVNAHVAANRVVPFANLTEHLPSIFGQEASYCDKTIIDDINYPTIMGYWNVKDATRTYIGRVYQLSAPGEHGAMHALVGVKPNHVAGGEFFKIWTNATSPHEPSLNMINAYIAAINKTPSIVNKPINPSTDDAVTGGTTAVGTRNGIRGLCLTAVQHYGENIIADIYTEEVFGDAVSYVEKQTYNDPIMRESWNVLDKENNYVGRVYHVALKGKHATLHALVGFHHVKVEDKEGKVTMVPQLAHVYLVNRAPGVYGDKLQAYVDNLNAGNLSLQDDIHNGATASSMGLRDIINQAFDHYLANPLLPLLKDMSKLSSLFGEEVTFDQHRKLNDAQYPNLVEYWNVKNAAGQAVAYAYHCAFPGKHSIMEITVSITTKEVPAPGNRTTRVADTYGKINLFATAPNKYGEILTNYVKGLNDRTIDINDDIHNGASSSSNAVKTMVLQALNHAKVYQLDAGLPPQMMTSAMSEALSVFGEGATNGQEVLIKSLGQDNLLKYWDVTGGKTNGRIYLGSFPGEHGVIHCLVSVDAEGNFMHVVWVDAPKFFPPVPEGAPDWTIYPKKAIEYIAKINAGEININDDVNNGATGTTGGIMTLIHQSLDHYNLNKIGG